MDNWFFHAKELAEKDKYLRDLLTDWLNETDSYYKDEMYKEIMNYIDENKRQLLQRSH